MTALSDSAERAKQRSGYALRPPASLTLICLLARACRRGADRADDGRCRHSAGAAAGRARPVGGRCSGAKPRARPARAVVDPDSADRRSRDGGRPARRIGRHHAGAVSQSPRRSRTGRRFLRRRVRGGGSDRIHRQPDRRKLPLHAESIAAGRGVRGLAGRRRSSSIRSRAARGGRRSRSSCWPALRLPPSPMPASGFWCSSPTTASCAISRSGCWAR